VTNEVEAADCWSARRLSRAQRDFLAAFEPTVTIDVMGVGTTLFCHAAPLSDEAMITPRTPPARVRELVGDPAADLVVAGHTHIQFERADAGVRFVNPGSVGWPYGDRPGAYWATLDAEAGLTFRRSDYDFEAAATAIRGTEWPIAAAFADENIVSLPSAADAIHAFEDTEDG